MPSQRTLACRQNHAICSQIGIIKNTVSDIGDNWSSALLLPSDYPSSKSWRSPQYALGRALQDKPACHAYAHIETHTHDNAFYHGMMTRLSLDCQVASKQRGSS